jgi:Mn-containing catalase
MDDIDLNSKQKREVFEKYGLAMYYVQCVERSLAMLISSVFNKDFISSSPNIRDGFYNQAFSRTLGRLIKELEMKITMPPNLKENLIHTLNKRNWLVHNYFYERAGEILTSKGREKMINELTELMESFERVDNHLESIIDKWVAKIGITNEVIKEKIKKLIDKTKGI